MAPRLATLACALSLLAPGPAGAVSLEPGDVVLNGLSALHRVDPETGRVERISVDATLGGSIFTDVVVSGSGEVYAILASLLGFFYPSQIVRLDLQSGGLETIATPGLNPRALAVEPDGSLLFAADERGFRPEPGGGLFRLHARSGEVRPLSRGGIFEPGLALLYPWNVAVGPSGEIVVSLLGSAFAVCPGDARHFYGLEPRDREPDGPELCARLGPRLVEVDPETGAQRLLSDPLGGMLAFAPDGGLFVYDIEKGRLVQVDLESGAGSLVGSSFFCCVQDLAADLDGTLLAVASRAPVPGATMVLRVDPVSGETDATAWGPLPAALAGLAVVPGLPARIDVALHRGRSGIALSSRTLIVALFGAEGFDVHGVDPASLAFGPGAAPLLRPGRALAPVDLDRDGHADLMLRFDPSRTGLAPGDSMACLVGELDARPFRGCDALELRGPSAPRPPDGRGQGRFAGRRTGAAKD